LRRRTLSREERALVVEKQARMKFEDVAKRMTMPCSIVSFVLKWKVIGCMITQNPSYRPQKFSYCALQDLSRLVNDGINVTLGMLVANFNVHQITIQAYIYISLALGATMCHTLHKNVFEC